MAFNMTEFTNELLSNVHVGGDMTEPKTGADVIPDATLDERLDELEADLCQFVMRTRLALLVADKEYVKAQDRHTAFLRLRTSSVKVQVVEPETDYKLDNEGSPETEPGKDKL